MNRRAVLVGLPLLVGACSRNEAVWAPDDAVSRYRFRSEGPPSLALITVRGEETGNGVHTALLITASERVLFDPAGGWTDPEIPERHDVLYGLTPAALERYLSYQASGGYYYVRQEKAVAPEVAQAALARAKESGPVFTAMCTIAVANLLRPLPGFEAIRPALLPETLQRQVARLPGVVTTERRGAGAVPEAEAAETDA